MHSQQEARSLKSRVLSIIDISDDICGRRIVYCASIDSQIVVICMSDTLNFVCTSLSLFCDDAMEGLMDILKAGGGYVAPVVRGLGEVLLSIVPPGTAGGGGSSKNNGKKGGRDISTGNGGGKPPGGFTFNRNIIRVAGLSGALAVGLGAYGAHVIMINDKIPEDQKHSFRTANMYHFIGTFGLVATSLSSYPRISGLLMAAGTTIFCGACYYHGLTGDPSVKKFAPYGGSTLIVAWLSLIL